MNCAICNLKIESQYDYINCVTDQCNNYAHNVCVAHSHTLSFIIINFFFIVKGESSLKDIRTF